MDKSDFLKYLGFSLIVLLIVNVTLFATRIINAAVFWILIIAVGIFAYKILPKYREKSEKIKK